MLERAVLEKLAAMRDVKRVIAPLRKMVEAERQAFLTNERPKWIRLSAEFHTALAELSRATRFAGHHDAQAGLAHPLIIASVEAPGNNACSFDEHEEILDALEQGDAASGPEPHGAPTSAPAPTASSRTNRAISIFAVCWVTPPSKLFPACQPAAKARFLLMTTRPR
ncbi:FCD domain-containing protein [Cupriavidus basilensis]